METLWRLLRFYLRRELPELQKNWQQTEQALAVHLSFHLKGGENLVPAARPQPATAA